MFSKQQKIIIITLLCLIVIGIGWFSAIIFFTPNNTNNFEKPTNTNDFEASLRDYKSNFQNYVLGNNEATYKDLIAQSEQAILNKDDKKILELKPALKALEDKVIAENTSATNTALQQLKSIDISKLAEDKKKTIDSSMNEIYSTISAKNFVKANAEIEKIRTTIDSELKSIANTEATKLAEEARKKPLTLETARALIFKEDSIFANNEISSGSKLSKGSSNITKLSIYNVDEGVFDFCFTSPSIEENDGLTSYYYVGKISGNVYRCSSVGGAGGDLNLIKNNKIVKTLKYVNPNQRSSNSSSRISSSDALKILRRAYPDYTFVDGGDITNDIHNELKGTDEPAYVFRFLNNKTKATYVGFVFLDGEYKFRCVSN